MSRFDDISSKFEYIEKLRQGLFDDFFEAKKSQADTKSIVHAARTILAESRECYDYCMQDIFELLVLPNTSNKDLINNYEAGKLKLYFPLYSNQLDNEVWKEIKVIQPELFQHVRVLVNDIEQNNQISNTLYYFGSILELKDMVNEKKHDKLLAIKSEDDQELLVENEGFKMILPLKQNIGMKRVEVSSGSKISLVNEFIFEYNQQEVNDFCMTALLVTRIVLDDIYSNFFNKSFLK